MATNSRSKRLRADNEVNNNEAEEAAASDAATASSLTCQAYDTLLGFEAKGKILEPMMSKRGIYSIITLPTVLNYTTSYTACSIMPSPKSKDLSAASLLL